MYYPSVTEIIAAAKDPQFIRDPFFEGASIKLLKSGRPDMYAGGFSQVFLIEKNKERWAFKVWHSEIKDNKERYAKIKTHLNISKLPYFSDFTYFENGLLVDGEFLDTFRMKWIDGLSLTEFISMHLKDTVALGKLAENFLKMTKDLHDNSISHGDLQHDNIFVTSNGEIKLLDYDSICVPEIDGQRDFCRGRYGFQHPSRFTAGYITSIKIDYFSELVIYLSILAVIENPTLWDKYNVVQAEYRLLFSSNDFLDFEYSPIKSDLNRLSPKIQSLVKILEGYLAAHINLTPFTS